MLEQHDRGVVRRRKPDDVVHRIGGGEGRSADGTVDAFTQTVQLRRRLTEARGVVEQARDDDLPVWTGDRNCGGQEVGRGSRTVCDDENRRGGCAAGH